MKILIAEDDLVSARILQIFFSKQGEEVTVVQNGREALEELKNNYFDVLLTDWMMPEMDGIELVRNVKNMASPLPVIIMFTAINSEQAKNHVLNAGVDDYIVKPYKPTDVLACIKSHLLRKQSKKVSFAAMHRPVDGSLPPFYAICLVAGSGGPTAFTEIFRNLSPSPKVAFFIVLHAPAFIIETFAETLQKETSLSVALASDGLKIKPGKIYVAVGDRHMSIDEDLKLKILDTPPENYVRPAVDILLRSAAKIFGANTIAIILTGLGRDGLLGATEVFQAGGKIFVQDPKTAFSSLLPDNIVKSGLSTTILPLEQISSKIISETKTLN
jgi:two-component system, chemotaxis family, protein-glutamate methylesterase/glutaminase